MQEMQEWGKSQRLERLATDAQFYSGSIVRNWMELGRVLKEAKPLIPHGEWQGWILKNTGLTVRSAQQTIQLYERFGNMPELQGVDKSKLMKLLPLAAEDAAAFARENDLREMSAREIGRAVREDEIDDEEAERGREEAEKVKALRDELQTVKAEWERLDAERRTTPDELTKLKNRNTALEVQLEMLQKSYDDLQRSNVQTASEAARGNAGRTVSGDITIEDFAAAVETFIGRLARVPTMGATFAKMDRRETKQYGDLVSTLEDWIIRAKKALNTVEGAIS